MNEDKKTFPDWQTNKELGDINRQHEPAQMTNTVKDDESNPSIQGRAQNKQSGLWEPPEFKL